MVRAAVRQPMKVATTRSLPTRGSTGSCARCRPSGVSSSSSDRAPTTCRVQPSSTSVACLAVMTDDAGPVGGLHISHEMRASASLQSVARLSPRDSACPHMLSATIRWPRAVNRRPPGLARRASESRGCIRHTHADNLPTVCNCGRPTEVLLQQCTAPGKCEYKARIRIPQFCQRCGSHELRSCRVTVSNSCPARRSDMPHTGGLAGAERVAQRTWSDLIDARTEFWRGGCRRDARNSAGVPRARRWICRMSSSRGTRMISGIWKRDMRSSWQVRVKRE